MAKDRSAVEAHYFRAGLYETIVDRLKALDVDLAAPHPSDLSPVDEFHVRGAAVTRELAAMLDWSEARRVLDVGCGLGGPCRFIAANFPSQVIGIDLSHEYVRTARALTRLVGLEGRVAFRQADATDLPFPDATFDLVWTQHVQMNVADKDQFYREMARVLRPGGTLLYYDIFQRGAGPIHFPLPWAGGPELSHLQSTEQLERQLERQGLHEQDHKDETAAGIAFFQGFLQKVAARGFPPLGPHLLMGDDTVVKLANLLRALEDGRLVLRGGWCRKEGW